MSGSPGRSLDLLTRDLTVANVDGDELAATLTGIGPAETLVVVASKTFTTQETLGRLPGK